MRSLAFAVIVIGLLAYLAPTAMACGGHEARAADCLSKLFGDNLKDVKFNRADHQLTATLSDGSSASGYGAEQTIVDAISDFLISHGIQQTSQDPCDSTSNAVNVFEDANLNG